MGLPGWGHMQDGAAETELLLRAGRGDEAAFLLLYERHRTPVFRFACRMLGSAPQAEDVTQECFLSDPPAAGGVPGGAGLAPDVPVRHRAAPGAEAAAQAGPGDAGGRPSRGGSAGSGGSGGATPERGDRGGGRGGGADGGRGAAAAAAGGGGAVRVPGDEPGRRRGGVRHGRGDGEVTPPPGARAPAEDARAAAGGRARRRRTPGGRETRP